MCPGDGASGEGIGGAGTTPVILHMDEEATPAQVGAYICTYTEPVILLLHVLLVYRYIIHVDSKYIHVYMYMYMYMYSIV